MYSRPIFIWKVIYIEALICIEPAPDGLNDWLLSFYFIFKSDNFTRNSMCISRLFGGQNIRTNDLWHLFISLLVIFASLQSMSISNRFNLWFRLQSVKVCSKKRLTFSNRLDSGLTFNSMVRHNPFFSCYQNYLCALNKQMCLLYAMYLYAYPYSFVIFKNDPTVVILYFCWSSWATFFPCF